LRRGLHSAAASRLNPLEYRSNREKE